MKAQHLSFLAIEINLWNSVIFYTKLKSKSTHDTGVAGEARRARQGMISTQTTYLNLLWVISFEIGIFYRPAAFGEAFIFRAFFHISSAQAL